VVKKYSLCSGTSSYTTELSVGHQGETLGRQTVAKPIHLFLVALIWIVTVLHPVHAKLYTTKTPLTVAEMLNDKVLYYEAHQHQTGNCQIKYELLQLMLLKLCKSLLSKHPTM
jgi:hypothetical protein